MCVPAIVTRQRLGKHVSAATNIRDNTIIIQRLCLWVFPCISLSLLGNNSVKTFPRQRKIVGGDVFYAVRVISKESRWLVLPRTCLNLIFLKDQARRGDASPPPPPVLVPKNPKAHGPQLIPILSQLISVHALGPRFFNNHFNITLPSTYRSPNWSLTLSYFF
jgi:hypothetical protein